MERQPLRRKRRTNEEPKTSPNAPRPAPGAGRGACGLRSSMFDVRRCLRFQERHLFQEALLTDHEPVPPAFLPASRRLESRRHLRLLGRMDGKRVTTHGSHEPRAGTARGHSSPQRHANVPWRGWLAAGWKARAPAGERFMESGDAGLLRRIGTMNPGQLRTSNAQRRTPKWARSEFGVRCWAFGVAVGSWRGWTV